VQEPVGARAVQTPDEGLTTAFKDIGRVNQELWQHLVLTIDPRFKEVSYDPDADETW
jgi:hypothetical protein